MFCIYERKVSVSLEKRYSKRTMAAKRFLWICIAGLLFLNPENMPARNTPKVIAHRGYWKMDGSAQNSVRSLLMAHQAGAYGCEFDVNLTSDGVPVVCHGPEAGDIPDIRKATFAQASEVVLENGEKLPALDNFLEAAVECTGMRLVLEIKPDSPESEADVLEKSLELVRRFGLEDRLVLISFSLNVCTLAVEAAPGIPVQYLNGDKRPAELHALGIDGIDYHYSVLLRDSTLVTEAHDLGMEVNAWTVDDTATMEKLALLGVDYITTNEPVKAQEILNTELTLFAIMDTDDLIMDYRIELEKARKAAEGLERNGTPESIDAYWEICCGDVLLAEDNLRNQCCNWEVSLLAGELLDIAGYLEGYDHMLDSLRNAVSRMADAVFGHPRLKLRLLSMELKLLRRIESLSGHELSLSEDVMEEISFFRRNIGYADNGEYDRIEQRGHLKYDPVEWSAGYESIIDEAEKKIDARLEDFPRGMGFCFAYWHEKQSVLYEDYGIEWRTPSQMNPGVIFD